MKCISILLLMECATDIQNDAGITAEALAVEVLGQSMAHLRRHAIVSNVLCTCHTSYSNLQPLLIVYSAEIFTKRNSSSRL